MKTINNILAAVGEPNNITLFVNLFPMFVTMMNKSIEKEDLKELKIILKHFWLMTKTLNENNKTHKNYMTEDFFNTLGPILGKVLNLVSNAKKETINILNNKNVDIDEEDVEVMKENLAKICAPSTFVMEISG